MVTKRIRTSTQVRGQIKVKNWVYMVVIPWAITSYYPVDIPHIKLLTRNILTCIPTHYFDKKHDRSKHWGRSQLNPSTLIHRISLLLTLILSSPRTPVITKIFYSCWSLTIA